VRHKTNAFTVVAAIAAVVSIAGGSFILFRPLRGSGAAIVRARPSGVPRDARNVSSRGAIPKRGSAAPWIFPPSVERPAHALDAVLVIRKRNLLVLAHNEQLLEEADEQAFDSLHMPETSRLPVRRVNDEWDEKRRALLSVGVEGQTPEREIADADAGNAELDRTRGIALASLLGVARFEEFETAELAALSRLRERFRGGAGRRGAATSPPFDLAER
jgi:hypothetical protein